MKEFKKLKYDIIYSFKLYLICISIPIIWIMISALFAEHSETVFSYIIKGIGSFFTGRLVDISATFLHIFYFMCIFILQRNLK